MSKTAQDLMAAMPSVHEVEDRGTLANVAAGCGFGPWFSNKKPKIVKCGFYEKHHQHLQAKGLIGLRLSEFVQIYNIFYSDTG